MSPECNAPDSKGPIRAPRGYLSKAQVRSGRLKDPNLGHLQAVHVPTFLPGQREQGAHLGGKGWHQARGGHPTWGLDAGKGGPTRESWLPRQLQFSQAEDGSDSSNTRLPHRMLRVKTQKCLRRGKHYTGVVCLFPSLMQPQNHSSKRTSTCPPPHKLLASAYTAENLRL